MDVSGVVLRQAQSISGDLFNNTHSSKAKPLFPGRSISAGKWVYDDLSFARSRDFLGVSCSGFSDNGHLQYYVFPRCGVKKEMVKKEKKATKKKLKLVKGMMKNLSAYSEMGFPLVVADDSIGNQQEKMISNTTELLLAQLEKLKAEEKEIKRKHKEEKAKLKALKMESSSSSSESSDSDCGGQVIDMNSLRRSSKVSHAEKTSSSLLVAEEEKMVERSEDQKALQKCSSSGISNGNGEVGVEGMSVTVGASAERIDVCMGGKCKKLGAAALLEEFKTKVGIESESAVVGCKCMGKCKSAPNVRVSNQNQNQGGGDTSVRAPTNNPLYIGVGLEDVSTIVASFFGEEEKKKELGLMAAA